MAKTGRSVGGRVLAAGSVVARSVARAYRSWPLRIRLAVSTALAVALVVGGMAGVRAAAATTDPCNPVINKIVCENSKPGTPSSTWDIIGAGDASIQGFATDISVNVGQTVSFKIKTSATSYTIDIYRLGWYGGNGARKITSISPSVSLPQSQPNCITDPSTEIYDCGNWAVSASWAVPSSAVSGVYFARLKASNGDESHIPFVVRDDASTAPVFFQTSDTTWQAYNLYGGSDFYSGGNNGRAYKLSYNRPFADRGGIEARDFLFSNEYPMIRFLERNGYDMSYTTGVDSARRGNLIKNHKVFLSVGHDEYWSGQARTNVEAARDAGVSLAFFSGNEVYWKTRWEASEDGSNTAYRTLVCYKETWANAKIDPSSEWTGTWRDPRFSPPSDGGRPENGLTGTAYMANSLDAAITVPYEQAKLRLWRNTAVANTSSGQTATLAAHTLGYESDEDLDNGFRPAGTVRLSKTVVSTSEYLQDYGTNVAPGTTTHSLTLYRAASGALVFSAGTIQWAWGLDQEHDGDGAAADPSMQQATINLLADMGVQPDTLMSGMVAATASTDTQAPTVTITSPASGASVANGSKVTVQGTASDAGGRVGGVEVSTDGGTTWHPATGTTSWSYAFYTGGLNTEALQVRAVDDSANTGQAVSLQLTLTGPNTLFGDRVPATPATNDPGAYELGVKFTPQVDGVIKGVRFYKGTGNTGTHTGSLWSTSGTRLATGTFSNETSTGWQTLTFSKPVTVTAGVTYVASYYTPSGNYAAASNFFTLGDYNAYPLVGPKSTSSSRNGVYHDGAGFPIQSFGDANYYVDVLFLANENAPPAVVVNSPLDNATGVSLSAQPSATFSKAMNAASIVFTLKDGGNAAVAGSVSYDSTSKTATFTPSAPLNSAMTYTATVNGSDSNGNAMEAPATWSFKTTLSTSVQTLFAADAIPTNVSANDSGAVELGVKFVPAVNGQILGVRFYQGAGNTGTHTGSLWSADGTLLAQVTFGATSGSGWQEAAFSTPVNVTAYTVYVASYYAPMGGYSYDSAYFASTRTNGSLTAPGGTNGVYRYGSGGGFPTSTYNSTNYWVDPLFLPSSSGPSPSPSPSPTPTPSGTLAPSVSIFSSSDTPASDSWPDTAAIEVGVKFTSSVDGWITGVKFYKGASNTGPHTGSLWTSGGALLASADFSNETASGWQTVTFSQPVFITANTTYVASYHTMVGYYAVTANQFATSLSAPPLSVPANGGVYGYGFGGAFPANSVYHNYWVDVLFSPAS